ncbi:unnamed protein product [Clonostachys rosea f. rosea IK726]|jgi:beta-glucanase (GH16 family)|uniref:GH16 domain-containing protein n=3 Tax=Bionectria ochroleuca TaxID=29856 RepID=A0A0B7KN13_BIOOC|nr:unnamed protein product [Clonostachys rosea f. rosea IK726]
MKPSTIYGVIAAASLAQAIQPPALNGFKLTWGEDFKGAAGAPPDSTAWTIALDLQVNNELQTYTTSNKNLQLSGGETLQIVPVKGSNGAWSSGRIESKASYTPQPGKKMQWQAGIRMGTAANRKGLWPAWWMLGDAMRHGTGWPMCGELDIFEQINGLMEGFGTIHCGQKEGGVCNEPKGRGVTTTIPDNEFHNWALVVDRTSNNWQTETIQWLRDGAPFSTVTGAEIGDQGIWSTLAHSPFYMLLNVAVGGNLPGDPDASTESGYGNMMEVSYVGVYESV